MAVRHSKLNYACLLCVEMRKSKLACEYHVAFFKFPHFTPLVDYIKCPYNMTPRFFLFNFCFKWRVARKPVMVSLFMSACFRAASEATSSTVSSPAGTGRAGADAAAALYNGAGRAYQPQTRNADAAAAAAAGGAAASSSELSESDNEAGFNRSSADSNGRGTRYVVNGAGNLVCPRLDRRRIFCRIYRADASGPHRDQHVK